MASPFLTGGCASEQKTDTGGQPATKVSYLTAFGLLGRDCYAHLAKDKFMPAAGIDVDIQAGQPGVANLKVLLSGKVDFIVLDSSTALIEAAKPTFGGKYTIVAVIQQRSLLSLMALPDSGIESPKDLQGKTIGGVDGSAPKTLLPVYAKLSDWDVDTIKWVSMSAQQTIPALASRKVDAIGQFVVGARSVAAAAKAQPVVLPYSDYITDLPGIVLATSTETAKERPDLVRRFAAALVQGVAYGVDHPQEAGEALHRQVPTADAAQAASEMELMKPYVVADAPPGVLKPERVARAIALLHSVGLMPRILEPEQVVNFDLGPQA